MFKPKRIVKLATCIACILCILSTVATSSQNTSLKTSDPKMMRLDVQATDNANQLVKGLKKEDFKITDNGEPQEISLFSAETLPISYGLLIDTSPGSRHYLPWIDEAITRITSRSKKGDKAFVMRFADNGRVQLLQDWTEDQDLLIQAVRGLKPTAKISVLDAMQKAIDHLEPRGIFDSAVGRHTALVVITDGNENRTGSSEAEMTRRLRELDVQVFIVCFPDLIAFSPSSVPIYALGNGMNTLEKIAKTSGGAFFFPENRQNPHAIAGDLLDRIRSQYVIGYHPGNLANKDKNHKIKVELVKRPGLDKFVVKTRTGYSKPEK